MSICLVGRKRRSEGSSLQATSVSHNGETPSERSARHRRTADTQLEDEVPSTSQSKRPRHSSSASNRSQGETSRTRLSQVAFETAPRCGKIQKINLVNFMCHSKFSIDLHERVNFLVGSNGSGKSAILAALVVGLGARARVTNRSGALHNLVKNGESSARIEITILNDGPEAYEPEVYGKYITIVRTISQSRSTYKIKNAIGNVISEKGADLHSILMYHNIQVENPVFVMNQDSAREFLKEMEPKKNYMLFLKATQLELIQETLKKCELEYQEQTRQMKTIKLRLENDEKKVRQAEAKRQQLLTFVQRKKELHQKKVELAWLRVTKSETMLQRLIAEMESIEKKKLKISDIPHKRALYESQYHEKLQQCRDQIKAKNSSYQNTNMECQKINSKLSSDTQQCQEIEYAVKKAEKHVDNLKVLIEDLHKNINDRADNMGIAEKQRENENHLIALRKQLTEIGAMIESTKRECRIFIENKRHIEENRRTKNERIQYLHSSIDAHKSEIARLQSNANNSLSTYGPHVQNLLTQIERHHQSGKFSAQPRGPIGRYIQVPNVKYRNVVENEFGGLLQGFIVNSTEDRILFNQILRQTCPADYHPTIVTMRFQNQVYNVRQGRVQAPPGTVLLMDVLQCSDAVTMNCLIDQGKIETILVTDTKDVAERFTEQRDRVPHNLRKILVLEPSMEYYPDPKYRMYSLKLRPARFIQVNVDDRIRQIKVELNNTTIEIKNMKAEVTELDTELRTVEQRLNDTKSLLKNHTEKCSGLEQRISELENYEYPASNEIDVLRNELSENQRKLDSLHGKLSECKVKLQDARAKKSKTEREMSECKSKMTILQQEIKELENNEGNVQMRLHQIREQSQQVEIQLEQFNDKLQEFEERKKGEEKQKSELEKNAKKLGSRCDTSRSEEDINNDIRTTEAQIRQSVQVEEDPDLLNEQIESMKHTNKASQVEYETLKLVIAQLRESQRKRKRFLERFKRHMVVMLQCSFDKVLSMRRFTGSIDANHDDHTLVLNVVPRDHNTEGAVSNTRALSGGERSYTTVAFLISLWSCVDHPFFFLDEYDVFTDDVNREYMTKLLLEEGEKRPNRQYTFLTPQDMSLKSTDFIRIHRLAEPNRR